MKNLKLFGALILVFFAATIIPSCKDNDGEDYKMDNQAFVSQASNSNNFEIAAGNLAKAKGQSILVQQYGDHMVIDHTAVGTEMMVLANGKGWSVSTDLQPKEQALLNTLDSVSGGTFDLQFAAIMVASHQDAITLFEEASSRVGVRDADLRNFAASKLPALRNHLEEARTLQTQIQ